METHYKIRHRITGLYSKGTAYNQWSDKGKTFDTIGKLRSFITRCLNDDYMQKHLVNFEIVEFEFKPINVKQLHDIVKPEKIMELLKR